MFSGLIFTVSLGTVVDEIVTIKSHNVYYARRALGFVEKQ